MAVSKCLILAAGFGTRMGKVGEHLPKPLWPVFELSLLELQIEIAKSLGLQDIYINIHYHSEKIKEHFSAREDIHFLYERELLDTGGAVHNLARNLNPQYKGELLIINSDLLFNIDAKLLKKMELELKRDGFVALLTTKEVDKDSGYNKLLLDKNRLVGIEKYEHGKFQASYQTYTGVSLVDLALITKNNGISPFFESVANFRDDKVGTIESSSIEYLDFGTKRKYFESIRSLAESQSSLRMRLEEMSVIDKKHLNNGGINYHAPNTDFVFNFSGKALESVRPSQAIIIKGPVNKVSHNSILCGDTVDEIY